MVANRPYADGDSGGVTHARARARAVVSFVAGLQHRQRLDLVSQASALLETASDVLPRTTAAGPTLACDVHASLYDAVTVLGVVDDRGARWRLADQLADMLVSYLVEADRVAPESRNSLTLRSWLRNKHPIDVQTALRDAAGYWRGRRPWRSLPRDDSRTLR